MPAFHTHWLVALAALSKVPKYIRDGSANYFKATQGFRSSCIAALKSSDFAGAISGAERRWGKSIRDDDTDDNITCFSAYMLGACGPDFWTVTSEPKSWLGVPSRAKLHFDLGHYNRTHRQFELSIAEVGGKDRDDLQTRVQRSYFLGMATHVAADLVVHQLVNVMAGAYNLLEEDIAYLFGNTWVNEHGGGYDIRLWNTHNKVEHFWDSYVRYHYLGDLDLSWPTAARSQGKRGQSTAPHKE